MNRLFATAFALAFVSPLSAQTTAPVDLSYATPLPGNWSYVPAAAGGEANFADTSGRVQLSIRCVRATRRLAISKPVNGAVPNLTIWTSSATRSLPASFNPATGRASADVAATDPLLDAMTFSRGRIAISSAGVPALVLPPWPEVARVIEDCRA